MINSDEYTWYINMSPFNRYLAIDILKTIGISILVIGVIQILPLSPLIKTFSVDIGGVLIIIYLFRKLLKQFSSFSGISIRFILDKKGATMMEDHDASGLKYVAEQVSTMRWDPMHSGSQRASNIKPRIPRMAWGDVVNVTENPKKKVIVLRNRLGGTIRLLCNVDNYENVLDYVNNKANRERYVQ